MLFDKIAQVSILSRNANMVSTRNLGVSFQCNIQPMGSSSGFGGSPVYNQYVLYTDAILTLKEGDKIVSSGETYIIKDTEDWRGTLRNFLKVVMEKSRGS